MASTRRAPSRALRWAGAAGLALGSLLVPSVAAAEEPAKRPIPDYEGRKPPPPTVGETLLWIPRIIFSPLYFTSEYLLRRPIGAVITAAERSDVPRVLYDFFAFGPDHKAGFAPIAFGDFGLNPSVGVYGFWNDAFFKGDDLQAHVAGWPTEWLGGSVMQRIRFHGRDSLAIGVAAVRRPDYPFFGLGPRTLDQERSRYGSDRIDGNVTATFRSWRGSEIKTAVGLRAASFYDGHYGHDPGILEQVNAGAYPLPTGFDSGYTAAYSRVVMALDSRQPFPHDGSGFRLEGTAEEGSGFGGYTPTEWLHYGGAAGGFLDLDGKRRVVSVSVQTIFVDPVDGGSVPFTELATLGGDKAPMPGFLPGRMIDRSAAVATLRYRWPIGPWLDGSMQLDAGNVFGEHLDGFDTRLLRLSGALGIESDSAPDSSVHFLIGFGTETFAQGTRVDSFRLALGTDTGL